MKISAQEEYGLRILIRIMNEGADSGLSISQLSKLEGLSHPYVAKLTRKMRMASLIESQRGQRGGYILSKPAKEISLQDILRSLGGNIYDEKFCKGHTGQFSYCANSIDCSIRSLWKIMQLHLENLLESITLEDLGSSEIKANLKFEAILTQLQFTE